MTTDAHTDYPRIRMEAELEQLNGRIAGLEAFMASERFARDMTATERLLCAHQASSMRSYAGVLAHRIAIYRPLPVEA